MGKKATSIKEQIQLLEKRGMVLDLGKEKTEEVLLDIGYYRLGFYWNPFEEDGKHNFKKGTKFSDALALYYIDSDLRHVFTKYLNRLEVNFKTKLIYEVSNHYKSAPTWFADPNIVGKEFVKQLPKYYNQKFKNNNKAIKKHHSKYINQIHAPAWKTLEFMPFGSILTIYRNVKNEDLQKIISNYYEVRNHHYFINHLRNLVSLRNICAHGGQLYDLQLAKANADIHGLTFKSEEKNNLYGVFKLLTYYLSKISKEREKDFTTKTNAIFAKYSDNKEIKAIIENRSGFLHV